MDTIFAVATAAGRSGVAVVRISGERAQDALISFCGDIPKPRYASLRKLKAPDGSLLDSGLVIFFPGPNSFTGEDVVEFQIHGSIAIRQAILRVLGGLDGFRLAEPGEFTRRALTNGRMNLTEVEGLADLIDAETESQMLQAQKLLSGRLGEQVEIWRQKMIRAAALLEATIDFADEEVPEDVSDEVLELLDALIKAFQDEAVGSKVGERLREGFEVAIIGPPNVGKSTLINTISGRDAAITSSIAGTTRDVIEVRMDLDGLPVTFLDTAGLHESRDAVEQIGIERAKQRAETADLTVVLLEPGGTFDYAPTPDNLVLYGKGDTVTDGSAAVSGLTGEGVGSLLSSVKERLEDRVKRIGVASRQRHGEVLQKASENLKISYHFVQRGPEFYDVAAEEIRISLQSVHELVGRVNVDDLLSEIFSSFCVGK